MPIGELARELGVTTKAVRFYEARGLLPGPARVANGYRDVNADAVQRLRVLVGLRRLDVPLDEAAELAGLCAPTGSVTRRPQIARRTTESTRSHLAGGCLAITGSVSIRPGVDGGDEPTPSVSRGEGSECGSTLEVGKVGA